MKRLFSAAGIVSRLRILRYRLAEVERRFVVRFEERGARARVRARARARSSEKSGAPRRARARAARPRRARAPRPPPSRRAAEWDQTTVFWIAGAVAVFVFVDILIVEFRRAFREARRIAKRLAVMRTCRSSRSPPQCRTRRAPAARVRRDYRANGSSETALGVLESCATGRHRLVRRREVVVGRLPSSNPRTAFRIGFEPERIGIVGEREGRPRAAAGPFGGAFAGRPNGSSSLLAGEPNRTCSVAPGPVPGRRPWRRQAERRRGRWRGGLPAEGGGGRSSSRRRCGCSGRQRSRCRLRAGRQRRPFGRPDRGPAGNSAPSSAAGSAAPTLQRPQRSPRQPAGRCCRDGGARSSTGRKSVPALVRGCSPPATATRRTVKAARAGYRCGARDRAARRCRLAACRRFAIASRIRSIVSEIRKRGAMRGERELLDEDRRLSRSRAVCANTPSAGILRTRRPRTSHAE